MKSYGQCSTPGGTLTGIPLPKGPVVHARGDAIEQTERKHANTRPAFPMHNAAEFTRDQLEQAGYTFAGTKRKRTPASTFEPTDKHHHIVALYTNDGLSLAKVAEQVGMSPAGVRGVLDRMGIPRVTRTGRRGNLVDVPDATLIAAYVDERLSCREIGERLGSSESAISRRLRATGITMRAGIEAAPKTPRGARRPDLDRDAIARQYADGAPSSAIATQHQCSERTVLTIVRAAGVPIRNRGAYTNTRHELPRPRRVDLDEAQVRELYLEKRLTASQCADTLGCSLATMRRALRRFEVPLRDDRHTNSGPRNSTAA